MIKLSNSIVSIEIAEPYTVYNGPRFDGTGIITKIEFCNHSFCELEQRDPSKGSGGIGFCNEFGIDKPIDYNKTQIGDSFPKIGVGLVTKETEKAYDFFAPAKVVTSTVINEIINEESYEVTTLIKNNLSYDLTLTKTISLKNSNLIIDYHLVNKGIDVIKTNEYNHNFIGIDHDNIGQNYELTIYNLLDIEKTVGEFEVEAFDSKHTIRWNKEPQGDFYAMTTKADKTNESNWELVNLKHKVGVRECSNFKISKIALWGYNHVVCPEVFIDLEVKPNQSMTWSRIYEFFEV